MAVRTLFIANRGEIAVRIIKAAKALGIRTVQAVSAADRDMLAARLADATVEIGPAHAAKSYLNKDAVVAAAVNSGADAVHPGYGFLAENAEFAEKVEAAGLIFVGPRPETIRAMGDKAVAREIAAKAGVPTVLGSHGRVETVEAALRAADAVGYPLMIKAAAGGGGRGIRVAHTPAELQTLIRKQARRRSRPSETAGFISSVSSSAPAISRFRSSVTASERSISTSANVRFSGAGKRSGRRRLPPASRQAAARRSAHPPFVSRKASDIAARARWNISTKNKPASSSLSR